MLFIVKKQFKVNNEVPLSVLLCISEKTLLQNAEIGIFLFIPLHTRRFYFCNKKNIKTDEPVLYDGFICLNNETHFIASNRASITLFPAL